MKRSAIRVSSTSSSCCSRIALRFIRATQHEVVRCRPGIVTSSKSATIPHLRCTASRCTACGKHANLPTWRGYIPLTCPLYEWARLWLTPAQRIGSLTTTPCTSEKHATAAPRGGEETDQGERRGSAACQHERATTACRNLRLLPSDRACGIHLRPPRRQRRQACGAAAQRRPHHHRHARPHPRFYGGASGARRAAGDHRTHARGAAAAAGARRRRRRSRPAIRRATSASSTTGKNICCSSTPAARNGRSRTASPRNWRISIRTRRRCASSTPASATARCSPA